MERGRPVSVVARRSNQSKKRQKLDLERGKITKTDPKSNQPSVRRNLETTQSQNIPTFCTAPDAQVLTSLFWTIACRDVFIFLQEASVTIRKSTSYRPKTLATSISETFRTLESLDRCATLDSIHRRFYLSRLVEHQGDLVKQYKQKYTYTLRQQPNTQRAMSFALLSLVQEAYPDIPNSEQEAKRDLMRKRVDRGVIWKLLMDRFSIGILVLLPKSVVRTQIERVPRAQIEQFLNLLEKHRGPFLRKVGKSLTQYVQDVVLRSLEDCQRYVFEEMDIEAIRKLQDDSENLVQLTQLA
ncbi:MAG: hypothetical protein Q9198_007806 [Flavoplaca austrocitrina]